MAAAAALIDPSFDVDKLSYEIFSILESKFLFGYDEPKLFSSAAASLPETPTKTPARCAAPAGRVRILSIDGGGRAADGILAAVALSRLEASLRERSGDPGSRIADYFDVAAGSGAGGVLAAMLFARGPDGARCSRSRGAGVPRAEPAEGRPLRREEAGPPGNFPAIFAGGDVPAGATLRDTVGPVLIPCYDLATGAPFLFSRADAVEGEGFDFRLREVCAATCAAAGAAVEMRSVDGRARIAAVGPGWRWDPAAAAITHVLNNKREFPLAAGVENLLVVSLGCGEAMRSEPLAAATPTPTAAPPPAAEMLRIAAESAADM
ncbi:Patatin-like protein 3, partial [Ananas comosus]